MAGSDEISRGRESFSKMTGRGRERRTHYFSTHGTLVVAIIVVRALWFLPGPASASRVVRAIGPIRRVSFQTDAESSWHLSVPTPAATTYLAASQRCARLRRRRRRTARPASMLPQACGLPGAGKSTLARPRRAPRPRRPRGIARRPRPASLSVSSDASRRARGVVVRPVPRRARARASGFTPWGARRGVRRARARARRRPERPAPAPRRRGRRRHPLLRGHRYQCHRLARAAAAHVQLCLPVDLDSPTPKRCASPQRVVPRDALAAWPTPSSPTATVAPSSETRRHRFTARRSRRRAHERRDRI